MPGWRVGWAVFSDPAKVMADYREAVNKLLRARLCSPHPQQYMVAPALTGGDAHLPSIMAKLTSRRDLTVKMLNAIPGITCVKPGGAFYAFPKVQLPPGINDEKYVLDLLEETGVLVVYGSGFGQKDGTNHFRIVFLPDEQILAQAYQLIGEFTERFYRQHHFEPVK